MNKNQAFWYIVGMTHARLSKVPKYFLSFSFSNISSGEPVQRAFEIISGEIGSEGFYKPEDGRILGNYKFTSYSKNLVDRVRESCGDFSQVPSAEDFLGESYLKGVFDGGFVPLAKRINRVTIATREVPRLCIKKKHNRNYLYSLKEYLLNFEIKSSIEALNNRVSITELSSLKKCLKFFSKGDKKEKLSVILLDHLALMEIDYRGRAQKLKREYRKNKIPIDIIQSSALLEDRLF